jgi:hypothetical protein
MGIGMPLVGYVAATAHGANPASKPNLNKRAEVDSLMGLVRIAFQDGWADCLVPSGIKFNDFSEASRVPEKNFEHRIFFDHDLENRPQLLAAIDFLKSDPIGGTLCVISIDDIKIPTGPEVEFSESDSTKHGSQTLRSIAQCYAIHELERIPIIECGRRKDPQSLVSQFARIPAQKSVDSARSAAVDRLLTGALLTNAAHRKRLDISETSCVLGRLRERQDEETASLLEGMNVGLACEKCAAKLRGPLRGSPRR